MGLSLSSLSQTTVSFLSAAGSISEQQNKKRMAKKGFEINFDEDIDFETYFRKTKVCTEFLPLCCVFSHICVLALSSASGLSHSPLKLALCTQYCACSLERGLLIPTHVTNRFSNLEIKNQDGFYLANTCK